jgi:hypothetical protein
LEGDGARKEHFSDKERERVRLDGLLSVKLRDAKKPNK